jgi:hypothetical protein
MPLQVFNFNNKNADGRGRMHPFMSPLALFIDREDAFSAGVEPSRRPIAL